MTIQENTSNDESLARELQAQFRREVEQYASSSAWNDIHTVFTPDSGGDEETFQDTVEHIESIPVVDGIPEGSATATPPPKKKHVDTSYDTQSTSPSTSLDGSPFDLSSSGLSGPVSVDEFVEIDVDSQRQTKDEALARRLDREMRDESLARQLRASQDFYAATILGDADLARRLARENEAEARRGGRRRGIGPEATRNQKIIYYGSRILSVVLVICVSYLVFMMVWGRNMNSGLDPASWLPGWPEGDPSLGSVGENNIWDMNGNYHGLTLQVLNNLEEGSDWHQYFETAIADWNDGTPDAVNLYLRSSSYDPDCRAVRKAMKVCNGNYGPTDWRGVNQILLQDEFIITSLAKMNDYYLEGTNMAQKQYTMCHELGHGLGLGHTDENFYNRDLGNCMDYTERPQNNMHPDESNFKQLEELYGNIDGTSVRPADDRMRKRRAEQTVDEEEMLDAEFEVYSAYLSEPIGCWNEFDATDGWRLLRKTESMEHHEKDLGNGYKVQKSILLAI